MSVTHVAIDSLLSTTLQAWLPSYLHASPANLVHTLAFTNTLCPEVMSLQFVPFTNYYIHNITMYHYQYWSKLRHWIDSRYWLLDRLFLIWDHYIIFVWYLLWFGILLWYLGSSNSDWYFGDKQLCWCLKCCMNWFSLWRLHIGTLQCQTCMHQRRQMSRSMSYICYWLWYTWLHTHHHYEWWLTCICFVYRDRFAY